MKHVYWLSEDEEDALIYAGEDYGEVLAFEDDESLTPEEDVQLRAFGTSLIHIANRIKNRRLQENRLKEHQDGTA